MRGALGPYRCAVLQTLKPDCLAAKSAHVAPHPLKTARSLTADRIRMDLHIPCCSLTSVAISTGLGHALNMQQVFWHISG
jgi:hypothetical protein